MRSTFERSVAALILVAIGTTACAGLGSAPRFVEPETAKPHALVTVRVVYVDRPDMYSAERLTMNGLGVDVPEGNRGESGVSFGFRAPPGTARWQLGTSFYHFETRMVTETYTDYESTYDPCASTDYKGHCRGGSRMRSVLKTRMVPRTVRVDKASCAQLGDYRFDAGASYTLSFKFFFDERCALECREQKVGSDGSMENAFCKAAPIGFKPEAEPAAPVAEAKKPSGGNSGATRSLGTTSIALGVVGLAGAAAAGTYALAMKSQVNDHCSGDRVCDSEGQDTAGRGKTAVKIGTVSGFAGAALVAGGIVLMNVGPREKPPKASVIAAPTNRGAQLSITGAF